MANISVSSINAAPKTSGLQITVALSVVTKNATVNLKVTAGSSVNWNLTGTTNASGVATFTLPKPLNKGRYHFIPTGVGGFTLDTSQGVADVQYVLPNSI